MRTDDAMFVNWMAQVDRGVYALAQVSVHDLGDCALRDMYDDGMSPLEAAHEALACDDLFADLMGEFDAEGW